MPNETILLSDVGGTNIRFALYRHEQMSEIIIYKPEHGKTYNEYIDRFWQEIREIESEQGWDRPRCAIIGAAGLIENGVVYSKNCPVRLDKASIIRWGFDDVIIENDFVTQSRAVKSSNVENFIWYKGSTPSLNGTVMVIGPGTGLGMSVIQESSKKRMLPRAAEAGFTSLPLLEGASKAQNQTIEVLREYMKREHKSRLVYDHIVSGTGIMRLFYARKHLENLGKYPKLQFNLPRLFYACKHYARKHLENLKKYLKLQFNLPRLFYARKHLENLEKYPKWQFNLPRLPSEEEKSMSKEDKLANNIRLDSYEICRLAEKNDPVAKQSVDYFLAYLGRFAGDQANVNLPDIIIYAGGVMCDPYIQKRMFEKDSPFLKEYKRSRLKAEKERSMAISTERAVAFKGLAVAAEEKLRKRRDEVLLKLSALNFADPNNFACHLVNKDLRPLQGAQTLNNMYSNTIDIDISGASAAVAGKGAFIDAKALASFTQNTR